MHRNPVYLDPTDPTAVMLKGSLELGLPSHILGQVLAAFPHEPPIPLVVLRYVFGPLIIHETQKGEADSIGWIKKTDLARWRLQVDLERIEILCGERHDLISPTELMLVMHNATYDAPLRRDLSDLYAWACTHAFRRAGKATEWAEKSNSLRLPDDTEVFEGNLSRAYREVCTAVIAKVVRHARHIGPVRGRHAPEPPP